MSDQQIGNNVQHNVDDLLADKQADRKPAIN